MDEVGYIVVIRPKARNPKEQYEALGYGIAYPGELLRDCGAAIFEDKEDAWAAINEIQTYKTWANNFEFGTIAVHKAIIP